MSCNPERRTVTAAKSVSNEFSCRTTALRLKLREVAFFERPVRLAPPIRFAAIAINAMPHAFPAARALCYREIPSKSCNSPYKSITNAVCAAKQAGLAMQQDLARGAFIGITHAKRNDHYCVDGFGDTPAAEGQAFAATHPDLHADAGRRSPFHSRPRSPDRIARHQALRRRSVRTGRRWRPSISRNHFRSN